MSRCAAALKLPPSKVPTDFIGDRFVNTAIGFMVVQTVLVTLRYYARYLRKTPLGADDFLLPIAALFSYGQQTIGILMVKKGGVGHRVEYNCVHQPLVLPVFAKLQISNTLTLTVGIAFAKLTILQLFLRIFVTKVYRYATYTVMAIQIACMIMVIVMTFVQCTPFAYIWEPQKHPHGHCIDKNAFWRWGNFPQVLTDVAILVLPLPALCALKLSTRDKVGVIVTFCTGGIGLITSIVRFAMFFAIDGQADAGWQAVPLGSISIAETSVYVFAACLPSYRTFFSNSMRRFGTSADGSASRGKPALYGSSKSHELRSLDKSSRSGFSRLTHDDEKKRDWTSEEELVANGGRGGDIGLRSIQVHKSFVLKNEPL